MKAIVLSSVPRGHAALTSAASVLDEELAAAGYDHVVHFDVADEVMGFCQGEFDCWLRTPGRCKIKDAEQTILEAIPSADALVLLGPISFGGFDSGLKRAIDRLIGLISPFFERRSGLTHHAARYRHYPRLFAVGIQKQENAGQRDTFDALNDANAVNLLAPERGSVALVEHRPETWRPALQRLLEQGVQPGAVIRGRESLRQELLAAARPARLPAFGPARTAALLVGSAKPKGTSASEQLARAFGRSLEAEGVKCSFHYATEFVHAGVPTRAAATALAAADLFVLATPLYVDSLPALVTRALESIHRVRVNYPDALFVPLLNCGFPEPEHIRTALRICRHFTDAAGYYFAGGLPLGGGGMVTEERLVEEAKPLAHVARAIRLAAPALAAGEGVPEAALREITKPGLPDTAYRWIAELGFRWEAHRRGTSQRELRARPFAPAR